MASLIRYGSAGWPAAGETIPIVTPFSHGGTGNVCCGQFRYFVLRGIPPDIEAIVRLDLSFDFLAEPPGLPPMPTALPPRPPQALSNQSARRFPPPLPPVPPRRPPPGADPFVPSTSTHARLQGLFIKRHQCPSAADIRADRTGCIGRCSLSYLVRYDPFSGASSYVDSTVVTSGLAPLSAESESADFYIGVQALRDERAEFTLSLSSRPRQRLVEAYGCSRLLHFCPEEQGDVGNASLDAENPIMQATSAARSSRAPPRPQQLALALMLGAICAGRSAAWRTRRTRRIPG